MKYYIYVLAGACSFGLLSTFVKKAYESGFQVGEVVGSQIFFGLIMMWIMAFVTAKSAREGSAAQATYRVSLKQALLLMLVGTSSGLTGIFYYAALQYVSASFAILLLFQFTWIGIVIEALIDRKRPSKEKLIALIFLVIGIIMASGYLKGNLEAPSWFGVGLGLLSALTYALFIAMNGRVAKQVAPITRGAVMQTGSFLIVMLIFPPHFLWNGSLHESLLPWALLLALLALLYRLYFAIGVPRIGGGMATIMSAAELPTAVIMSFVVLHESVNALQWIGVIITMLGIALPELIKRRKRIGQLQTD